MKRCSITSVIREMQIKGTIRYHFIPRRMAILKKKMRGNRYWSGFGEIETLIHC